MNVRSSNGHFCGLMRQIAVSWSLGSHVGSTMVTWAREESAKQHEIANLLDKNNIVLKEWHWTNIDLILCCTEVPIHVSQLKVLKAIWKSKGFTVAVKMLTSFFEREVCQWGGCVQHNTSWVQVYGNPSEIKHVFYALLHSYSRDWRASNSLPGFHTAGGGRGRGGHGIVTEACKAEGVQACLL